MNNKRDEPETPQQPRFTTKPIAVCSVCGEPVEPEAWDLGVERCAVCRLDAGHPTSNQANQMNDNNQPPKTCSVCGREFLGPDHNAYPLNDGRCCGWCNDTVIRVRIMLAALDQQKAQIIEAALALQQLQHDHERESFANQPVSQPIGSGAGEPIRLVKKPTDQTLT